MRTLSTFRRIAALALLAAPAAAGWAEATLRPEIVVADSASGCPSVAGSFVVLLDPDRGMLILSGAPFPGGHAAGDARGSAMTLALGGGRDWALDRAGSSLGQAPLWAARYPFLATRGSGCVGFDRERWSSEGDLVTYARWLVEEIYLDMPAEERRRRPDLRLGDRELNLRVEREGYGAVQLAGKEGSTLACRYEDSGRIYLFLPFIVDESAERVAVKVAATDGSYFDTSAKETIGWTVASPGEPGALAGTTFTVAVEGVGAAVPDEGPAGS
jgi:hypothetical protein